MILLCLRLSKIIKLWFLPNFQSLMFDFFLSLKLPKLPKLTTLRLKCGQNLILKICIFNSTLQTSECLSENKLTDFQFLLFKPCIWNLKLKNEPVHSLYTIFRVREELVLYGVCLRISFFFPSTGYCGFRGLCHRTNSVANCWNVENSNFTDFGHNIFFG